MKKYLLLFNLFISILISAQAPYGNEWVDVSKPHYKFPIITTNIYRISYSYISTNFPEIASGSINDICIYNNGAQIPIYISWSGTPTATDYIEFYGKKLESELDKKLYPRGEDDMINPYSSYFKDSNYYFITLRSDPNNARITTISNDTNLISSPYLTYGFGYSVLSAAKSSFSVGTRYYYNADIEYTWSPTYENGEGWTNNSYGTQTFPTPGFIGNSAINATLKTRFFGNNEALHKLGFKINGNAQGDTSFFGSTLLQKNFTFPSNYINSTSTVLTTTMMITNNHAYSFGGGELKYPRSYNFSGLGFYVFSAPNSGGFDRIQISNYNATNKSILYDLTFGKRIIHNATANPRFLINTKEDNKYAIVHEGAIGSIPNFSKVTFGNFTTQGDYIIITNKLIQKDSLGVDVIQEFKEFKESNQGGSFKVTTAFIDEINDMFGYGVPKHPLAIRKYLQWAKNTWTTTPKYTLLIGKGYNATNIANATPANMAINLIPSFGHTASDIPYVTMDSSFLQFMPIGRLCARDAKTVRVYLNKLKEYYAEYNDTSDLSQTPDRKEYMKWIIHLGGGQSDFQQRDFRNNLISFEKKIKDTLWGAKCFSVYKNGPDYIENVSNADLSGRFDKGVSFVTFFGHSSAVVFDVGISDPSAYTNKGKYPIFLVNGCNSGFFYNTANSYSENFINLPDKGAIGYLATTNNEIDGALYQYTNQFYDNFITKDYNKSIGNVIKSTSNQLLTGINSLNYYLTTPLEFNFNGDPSVPINQYSRPDYYIDNNSVISPTYNLNTTQDSFELKIIVQNLAKAINRNFKIKVERINNGNTVSYERQFKSPYFKDTYSFFMPIHDSDFGKGINTFNIKCESEDAISEMSEANNEIKNVAQILIESDDIIPIIPYDYSIVSKNTVRLSAMNTLNFKPTQRYHFQIDTSKLFNSPNLKTYTTDNTSETVVNWTPLVVLEDSMVYYWRVSKDTLGGKAFRWNHSSFIYLTNQPAGGWNQSHYYQLNEDKYQNISLNSNRKFSFINDVKNILVRTDGTNGTYETEWYLNNARQSANREWSYMTNGMFLVWINGKSGIAVDCYDSTYISGNANSTFGTFGAIKFGYPGIPRYGFVFQDTGKTSALHPRPNTPWSTIISDFVNQIPDGDYLIAFSMKKPVYNRWDPSLVNLFKGLGFNGIQTLVDTVVKAPFIYAVRKNTPSFTPVSKIGTDYVSKTTASIFITGTWKEGNVSSDKIGPSTKWNTLSYRLSNLENPSYDTNKVELIGIDKNLKKTTLASFTKNQMDTSLTWIDPNMYRYLQLKLSSKDDKDRSPTQLNYWRIYYDDIGEVTVNNSNGLLPKSKDTLENGDIYTMNYGVETLNNKNFDSMSLKISINQAGKSKTLYSKHQPIVGNSFSTYQRIIPMKEYYEGENYVTYEIDPKEYGYQYEKYQINNFGQSKFFVKSDISNPLLDVTFDGVHIVNNELISNAPHIKIAIKDDNKFLLLDDTALIKIYLKSPDGTINPIYFNQTNLTYTLANSASNNSAIINYNPQLADGQYQLIVLDSDKSGNQSSKNGNFNYKISFNVISKNQISQFINYPNPFTTSTQFVFTLTGSTVPDYIKIQIINIKGQIVKEIYKEQLGPLKLGVNRSVYAWDGRDEFGDLLANGVYLYKVTVKSNGEDYPMMENDAFKSLNKSQSTISQYFNDGWGKMVILR